MEIARFWQPVQDRVCTMCPDSTDQGSCLRAHELDCALHLYLPLLVNAVPRIDQDARVDYLRELRAIVCAQCRYQTAEGECPASIQATCMLNGRFEEVVGVIEDALATHP